MTKGFGHAVDTRLLTAKHERVTTMARTARLPERLYRNKIGIEMKCEEHDQPLGGCLTCVHSEMRRYQALYENAMAALIEVRESREATAAAHQAVDRAVFAFGAELATR
jgi:hypothetical protein